MKYLGCIILNIIAILMPLSIFEPCALIPECQLTLPKPYKSCSSSTAPIISGITCSRHSASDPYISTPWPTVHTTQLQLTQHHHFGSTTASKNSSEKEKPALTQNSLK